MFFFIKNQNLTSANVRRDHRGIMPFVHKSFNNNHYPRYMGVLKESIFIPI